MHGTDLKEIEADISDLTADVRCYHRTAPRIMV